MPFKSERQRRFLYAKHPGIARRWSAEEKVGKSMDLVELSKAMLGDHPADVEKGVGDVVRGAQKFGSEAKRGFTTVRGSVKAARSEAGYPSGLAGMKEGFQAGLKGNAKSYRSGHQQATKVGLRRAQRELRGRPASFGDSLNDSMDLGRASMSRGMSSIDFRLK